MKKRKIIDVLKKKKQMTFHNLLQSLGIFAKSDKSKLRKQLQTLEKDQAISITGNTINLNSQKKVSQSKEDEQKDFENLLKSFQIPSHFSKKVLAECENLNPKKIERTDLRDKFIVTIDGDDSKDLDDAISFDNESGKITVGVHIADVSFYVLPHTELDKEAFKRGNSYYFINRVVPMLPEALSNGLCSLNPHEEKKTMSIFVHFNEDLSVQSYEIFPSLIQSSYRLTYKGVEKILKGDENPDDKVLKNTLVAMNQFAKKMYEKRVREGSLEFDFDETKIIMNDQNEVTDIYKKVRLESEKLIEEFMLIANQSVAKFLDKHKKGIYRIHNKPSEEKLMQLMNTANKMGYRVNFLNTNSSTLNKFLIEMQDTPYKELFQQLMLRSMTQARYSAERSLHYGLGFEYYTHFTSPIRRYADLMVHRLLKEILFSQKSSYSYSKLEDIAEHISVTERVEMDAERKWNTKKTILFLSNKVGQEMPGMITGFLPFGMFVELLDYGEDGLIRFETIKEDYFEFDEKNQQAVGRRKKKVFHLGDKVKIKLKKVNVERGFIDLLLADEDK